MQKKTMLLRIISVSAILLGLVSAAVGLFVRMILGMDASWFISRFGPDGEQAYRTYDMLYEQSLIIIKVANRYTVAFCVSLGIGLLAFGITCGLWARDLKRNKQREQLVKNK